MEFTISPPLVALLIRTAAVLLENVESETVTAPSVDVTYSTKSAGPTPLSSNVESVTVTSPTTLSSNTTESRAVPVTVRPEIVAEPSMTPSTQIA